MLGLRFLLGAIHRNLSAAIESVRPRTPDSTTSILLLLLPTETLATPRNASGTSTNKSESELEPWILPEASDTLVRRTAGLVRWFGVAE
jgi:hypothetical protein